jgi:hypothetical protein
MSVTCVKCGATLETYDAGSSLYQARYGHALSPIDDKCLNKIFMHANSHGRSE